MMQTLSVSAADTHEAAKMGADFLARSWGHEGTQRVNHMLLDMQNAPRCLAKIEAVWQAVPCSGSARLKAG